MTTDERRWDSELQDRQEANVSKSESPLFRRENLLPLTGSLEAFHVSGDAEVETPQVQEKQQQRKDGDEQEGDDRSRHGHHADVLQKHLKKKQVWLKETASQFLEEGTFQPFLT